RTLPPFPTRRSSDLQLLGLADARRERLFDEDVLAGEECGARKRVVRGDGRGDDDGVEARVGEEFPVIYGGAGGRVAARDFFEARSEEHTSELQSLRH